MINCDWHPQKASVASSLSSSDLDGIRGQLHGARCVYNALSDIKPEVENVIKMGRKIVLSEEEVVEDRRALTGRIDALKAEFNDIGAQITEAKRTLERALRAAEEFQTAKEGVSSWMALAEGRVAELPEDSGASRAFLREKHAEAPKQRERVKSMQKYDFKNSPYESFLLTFFTLSFLLQAARGLPVPVRDGGGVG